MFAPFTALAAQHKYLYVAEPGVRDLVEYGGHGILVFDIDHRHKFVRRIATAGVNDEGRPLNVKGICANARTQRLYVSTTRTLMCFDLTTDKMLWEQSYAGGCDRMSISPDGRTIYLPSLEGDHWKVVEAMMGGVSRKIVLKSAAHNTIYGLDGEQVYLAGRRSPVLAVVDAHTREVSNRVGPFGNSIRPFTVNRSQTLCFVNVDDLLGFEIGDLKTGKVLHRVEVQDYNYTKGAEKRHACPSHGIGLTPDEKEIWLSDAANSRMHIFDATVMPPKQVASIALRDQPGWVTFSFDGRYAYPSTGEVIDVRTRKILLGLKDEAGRDVQSEKLMEIDFAGKKPIRVGDQFGLGRKVK